MKQEKIVVDYSTEVFRLWICPKCETKINTRHFRGYYGNSKASPECEKCKEEFKWGRPKEWKRD